MKKLVFLLFLLSSVSLYSQGDLHITNNNTAIAYVIAYASNGCGTTATPYSICVYGNSNGTIPDPGVGTHWIKVQVIRSGNPCPIIPCHGPSTVVSWYPCSGHLTLDGPTPPCSPFTVEAISPNDIDIN